MYTNIEVRGDRRRLASAAVTAVMCLAIAASGAAHDLPARDGNREIVRLQGYRAEAPPGVPVQRKVVLSILGEEHEFHVIDLRRFRMNDDEVPQAVDRARFDLQAERGVLVKVAGARPDQRVTILGERRATGSDLFILALDLCPPE